LAPPRCVAHEVLPMKFYPILALLACAAAPSSQAQSIQAEDAQAALLASPDPVLASNKKLVYDMYREVLLGGRADLVDRYFTVEYLQHNPNVASGRDALARFIRGHGPSAP
jgi:hypothetical protein